MGRALVALLACGLAAAPPAWAADAPPTPLAQSGELRLERDGTLRQGTRVLLRMTVAGAAPESGSVRTIPGKGGPVEVSARRGQRGRSVILAGTGEDRVVVVDEPSGPSADGDLVRRFAADGDGIRRWQESAGIDRCDARPPLFLERYDL